MGPRKNGRARGRRARGDEALAPLARLLLARAFFLAPIYFLAPFNSNFRRASPPLSYAESPLPGVTVVRVVWPGFESLRVDATSWVEFVIVFLARSEGFFSGYFRIPMSSKTNSPKFQLDWNARTHFIVSYVGKKLQNSQLKKCYTNFHVHGYI